MAQAHAQPHARRATGCAAGARRRPATGAGSAASSAPLLCRAFACACAFLARPCPRPRGLRTKLPLRPASTPPPPPPPPRPRPPAAAFPFFYIEPSKKEYRGIVSKFVGPVTVKEAEQIAPIGGWVAAERLGGCREGGWLRRGWAGVVPCHLTPEWACLQQHSTWQAGGAAGRAGPCCLLRRAAECRAPALPCRAGNAPTMLSWEDMKKVAPIFFNMSIAVHNDAEASKEWGWVQVGCGRGARRGRGGGSMPARGASERAGRQAGRGGREAGGRADCTRGDPAPTPRAPFATTTSHLPHLLHYHHRPQEMYAFTLSCFKAGIRGIDLHLKVGGGGGTWGRGVVRRRRRS